MLTIIRRLRCGRFLAWPFLLMLRSPAEATAPLAGDGGPFRDRTSAVSVSCPDDLTVACDGAGNVAEREAWLDVESMDDVHELASLLAT